MKAIVLLLSILTLGGCSSAGVVPGAATSAPVASAAAPSSEPPSAVSAQCVEEAGAFFDALADIDSRLDVGLNFGDYSERVGDAKVAYDKIDIAVLEPSCLTIAAKAEQAYNAYADAYKTWNDCISDSDCDNSSITPKLQNKWAEASELLGEVRQALP